MTRILCLALSLFCALPVFGAKETNNGAGLSEQNVVYAFENVESVLGPCLEANACGLSDEERAIVREALRPMVARNVRLVFSDRTQMGQALFLVSGSEWCINRDELWLDEGDTVPFALSDAVILLLEISGVQTGAVPDSVLERVRRFLSNSLLESRFMVDEETDLNLVLWHDRTQVAVQIRSREYLSLSGDLQILGVKQSGDPRAITRLYNPVLQGAEKEAGGTRIYLFVRLRIESRSGMTSDEAVVTLFARTDGPLELHSVVALGNGHQRLSSSAN